jgi:hypothetical protein
MCFYLIWANFDKLDDNHHKNADEDIDCWKVLNKNCSPLYGGTNMFKATHSVITPYKKGKVNPKIVLNVQSGFMINEGYHSYKTKSMAISAYDNHGDTMCRIKKFIIPKGTKYFENSSEYVSELITMK